MTQWYLILIGILVVGCKHSDPRNDLYDKNTGLYQKGRPLCKIKDDRLLEASGLEYSAANPYHFWTHNDSQGTPTIFLIDTLGTVRLRVLLKGAENVDWEDITASDSHLYIGDIGDNRAERDEVFIYRVKEPTMQPKDSMLRTDAWEKMTIRYSNGSRDAESLMYNHQTDELVIVSKREDQCYIYSFSYTANTTQTVSPKDQIDLTQFTAGDISVQGEILLKNYDAIFYWHPGGADISDRLAKGPDAGVEYTLEPQGEAICFDPMGNFYTLSEHNQYVPQQLYIYKKQH